MQLLFALLAERTDDVGEKMNIYGVCNTVEASGPGQPFPPLVLVAVFRIDLADRGRVPKVEAILEDPDGRLTWKIEGPALTIPTDCPLDKSAGYSMLLEGMVADSLGNHAFHVILDGVPVARVPLMIARREPRA